MYSFPSSPHDWANWLCENLQDIKASSDNTLSGRLPEEYDFEDVIEKMDGTAGAVGRGVNNAGRRLIEFTPAAGHVYRDLEQLVSTPANQVKVPDFFTVRSLGFTSSSLEVPAEIRYYYNAVQVWALLIDIADHVVKTPPSVFFIESPERKLEIIQKFSVSQLSSVAGIEVFSRDFVKTELHRDQKRNIIRSTLIDLFSGKSRVQLGAILESLDSIIDQVKASYAVFAADFSYQKVRDEVRQKNLDDTLRLNKTLSDIQNQLLALPAALILAAGGLEAGEALNNLAIVVGITIFAGIMYTLVKNQISSVESIAGEVDLRKELVNRQPREVSSRFEEAFGVISTRVSKQRLVLGRLLIAVGIVVASVLILAVYQSMQPVPAT